MKKIFLIILILLFSVAIYAADTDYYVNQAGSGTQDGKSLANAWSAANFNDAGNWSVGEHADKIDPADTGWLLDTITTGLTPQGDGTSGNDIILRGDYSGHACTLSTAATGLSFYNDDYFTVRNIVFAGASATMAAIERSHDITFDTCTFTGNQGGYGVRISANNSSVNTYNVNVLNSTFDNLDDDAICFVYNGEVIGTSTSVIYSVLINNNTFTEIQGDNQGVTMVFTPLTMRDFIRDNSRHPYGITITDNTFYRVGWRALTLQLLENTAQSTIARNDISYCGVYRTDTLGTNSISLQGCKDVIVENNTISYTAQTNHTGDGAGIIVDIVTYNDATTLGSDNTIVRYNLCYNNDDYVRAGGITIYESTNTKVYGNVCYLNGTGIDINGGGNSGTLLYGNALCKNIASGLDIYDESSNQSTIKNNIIAHNTGYGLRMKTGATVMQPIEQYNCVYGNPSGNYYDPDDGTWAAGTGSIEVDPQLISATLNDFTLHPNSPCINAGDRLGSTYDKVLHPASSWPTQVITMDQDDYGSGWEMGAYGYLYSSPRRSPVKSNTRSNTRSMWR